jgi:hypothetical protein
MIAETALSRHASIAMNPEKLFAYLDGRLSNEERAAIDARLESDVQLQRELAIAREIHLRARGEAREVIFQDEMAMANRGRKMALRVGAAAIALIALNVALGMLFIARKEASNPNHKLLEQQMREQLSKSLGQAANSVLTPPPLDVNDITIAAARGKSGAMADQVVAIAKRLGGSATKELPDKGRIGVLVDLAANREAEFRAAIATMSGGAPASPQPNESPGATKKSFVVQIIEQ